MRFFTYGDVFACEDCLKKDIEKTKSGQFTGDEAVTESTFAGTHGQCDNCEQQCDDYPDCEFK